MAHFYDGSRSVLARVSISSQVDTNNSASRVSRSWSKQQPWSDHMGSVIRGLGVAVLILCLMVSVEVSKDASWLKDHLAPSDLDAKKPLESLLLFSAGIGMFPLLAILFWRVSWNRSLFATLGIGLTCAWALRPLLPAIDVPDVANLREGATAVTMCLTTGALLLTIGKLIGFFSSDGLSWDYASTASRHSESGGETSPPSDGSR